MPPSHSAVTDISAQQEGVAVLVSDHWVNDFCDHVGSLSAVLQALSRVEGTDRPPALILEALDDCSALQKLLNAIPVWGGHVHLSTLREPITAGRVPNTNHDVAAHAQEDSSDDVGDNFPEITAEPIDTLPAVDQISLEERCQNDVNCMVDLLERFRFRAEGDLRELELLSVGHDWNRLSRMAGVLKDAAGNVSAYRIVVDAAALQGAARIGCRNDVDLALDALRADVKDCSRQIAEWQANRAAG